MKIERTGDESCGRLCRIRAHCQKRSPRSIAGIVVCFQSIANLGRILPTVDDGANDNHIDFREIEDCKGKRPAKQSVVILKDKTMNARGNSKTFNIRSEGGEGIIAEADFLCFVKRVSFIQIRSRGLKDSDSHSAVAPRESLMSSHSRICSVPFSTALRRAFSRSFCQSGTRTASVWLRRLSQRAYIIGSFS